MLRGVFVSRGLLALWAGLMLITGGARAADHRDAPNLNIENGGPRALDINDVYIFRSPTNANNVVMMLTVNPLIAPGEVVFFSSTGSYEFKIDNNGDVVPDITLNLAFTAPRGGKQEVRLSRIDGNGQPVLLARGQTGSNVAIRGGGQMRADVFDDPFFFDLDAFKGTGGRNFNDPNRVDFFKGFNTSIMVIEVPRATIKGATNVLSLWCRSLDAQGRQVDRMGIPAVNTAFVRPNRFIGNAPPGQDLKKAFNESLPVNDRATWGNEVRNALAAFGRDANTAAAIANVVLPDVLTFDVTNAGGFLNGRRLADDVIDIELNLITGGAIPTDSIPLNDKQFRNLFPYVAAPH